MYKHGRCCCGIVDVLGDAPRFIDDVLRDRADAIERRESEEKP